MEFILGTGTLMRATADQARKGDIIIFGPVTRLVLSASARPTGLVTLDVAVPDHAARYLGQWQLDPEEDVLLLRP